jgi:hypothetical protein
MEASLAGKTMPTRIDGSAPRPADPAVPASVEKPKASPDADDGLPGGESGGSAGQSAGAIAEEMMGRELGSDSLRLRLEAFGLPTVGVEPRAGKAERDGGADEIDRMRLYATDPLISRGLAPAPGNGAKSPSPPSGRGPGEGILAGAGGAMFEPAPLPRDLDSIAGRLAGVRLDAASSRAAVKEAEVRASLLARLRERIEERWGKLGTGLEYASFTQAANEVLLDKKLDGPDEAIGRRLYAEIASRSGGGMTGKAILDVEEEAQETLADRRPQLAASEREEKELAPVVADRASAVMGPKPELARRLEGLETIAKAPIVGGTKRTAVEDARSELGKLSAAEVAGMGSKDLQDVLGSIDRSVKTARAADAGLARTRDGVRTELEKRGFTTGDPKALTDAQLRDRTDTLLRRTVSFDNQFTTTDLDARLPKTRNGDVVGSRAEIRSRLDDAKRTLAQMDPRSSARGRFEREAGALEALLAKSQTNRTGGKQVLQSDVDAVKADVAARERLNDGEGERAELARLGKESARRAAADPARAVAEVEKLVGLGPGKMDDRVRARVRDLVEALPGDLEKGGPRADAIVAFLRAAPKDPLASSLFGANADLVVGQLTKKDGIKGAQDVRDVVGLVSDEGLDAALDTMAGAVQGKRKAYEDAPSPDALSRAEQGARRFGGLVGAIEYAKTMEKDAIVGRKRAVEERERAVIDLVLGLAPTALNRLSSEEMIEEGGNLFIGAGRTLGIEVKRGSDKADERLSAAIAAQVDNDRAFAREKLGIPDQVELGDLDDRLATNLETGIKSTRPE